MTVISKEHQGTKKSISTSSLSSANKSAGQPAVSPPIQPVETPTSEQPNGTIAPPASQSTTPEQPTKEAPNQPVVRHIEPDQPIDKPSNLPIVQGVELDQPIEKPLNPPVDQPTEPKPPVDKPSDQPIEQPIEHPIEKLTAQPKMPNAPLPPPAKIAYQIIVNNNCNENIEFQLFSEVPKADTKVGKAWTNVWTISPTVGSPGSTKFTITDENFAVCGNAPKELGPQLKVETENWWPVSLATAGEDNGTRTTIHVVGNGVVFDKARVGTTATAGSFSINSDKWSATQFKNKLYCGLGKRNQYSQKVVPVAVWDAEPSQQYIVTPVVKFYISTGNFEKGEIVQVTNLGAFGTIDFTGKEETVANVDYLDNKDYSKPVFSFASASN